MERRFFPCMVAESEVCCRRPPKIALQEPTKQGKAHFTFHFGTLCVLACFYRESTRVYCRPQGFELASSSYQKSTKMMFSSSSSSSLSTACIIKQGMMMLSLLSIHGLINVVSSQQVINVPFWDIPQGGGGGGAAAAARIDPMTAIVGDTFVFTWNPQGTHDVFIQDENSCDFNNIPSLTFVGDDFNGVSYTFTQDDIGIKYFSCTIGEHCNFGMIMAVAVSPYTSDEVTTVPYWGIPQTGAPELPSMASSVGETIRFTWDASTENTHDVWLQNTPSCDDPGPWEFIGNIPGVEYTFNMTDADIKTRYFVCYVNQHCQNGMVMEVSVSPYSDDEVTIVPYWGEPDEEFDDPTAPRASLPSMTAIVGETLRFKWDVANGEFHDVWLQNSNSCDDAGPWEFVGEASGVEYTFNSTDVGTKYFVCYVGEHCQNGMVMEVTITEYEEEEATPVPSDPDDDPSNTFDPDKNDGSASGTLDDSMSSSGGNMDANSQQNASSSSTSTAWSATVVAAVSMATYFFVGV